MPALRPLHLMQRFGLILALLPALAVHAAPASEKNADAPAKVLIVGTYHFDNPGLDLVNTKADDVLTPKRQREIEAVTASLARFRPNRVAVESDAASAEQRYADYRAGKRKDSLNEIDQLGFRLAAQQGLARVEGIDVGGEFPFEAVQQWAAKNGRADELGAMMQSVQTMVSDLEKKLTTQSIGRVLRDANTPAVIDQSHAFYAALMRFGAGNDQPGAALNAAWAKRNFDICGRLVQALKPGDRAVVFYGAGHSYWLRRCVLDVPGLELVEAADYLPRR